MTSYLKSDPTKKTIKLKLTATIMEITTTDLLWKVSKLPQLTHVRVGLSGKFPRILNIGTSAVIVGMIGAIINPIGIVIGAIIGGGSAAYFTKEESHSIPDAIMMKFTENQKCELAVRIRESLKSIKLLTTHDFELFVDQNPGLSKVVAETVTRYIESQNMKIINFTMTQV